MPKSTSEKKLPEHSEYLYRAIAANLPNGAVFVVNRDLNYVLAEGQALREVGIRSRDLEGKSLREALDPELASDYEPNYRKALSGTAMQIEHQSHGRDYMTHITPLRDENGTVYAAMAVSYDITERKRAEEKLKESEERFRAMADGLPLIVWVHDAEGNQQFVNQTFLEFFGTTHEEMKGEQWQLLMHPDDAQAYANEFLSSVREQRFFNQQVRVRHADGTWRWIESWGRPRFTPSGKYLGHVGTSADITERKQAEEALRESEARLSAILNQLPVGVGVIDTGGRAILRNDLMRTYMRDMIPSRDPEQRKQWHVVDTAGNPIPPDQWPGTRALRGESAMTGMEFTYIDDAGREQWTVVSAVPFTNLKGGEIGAIVVVQDITELKQAERALRETNQELNEYTYALTHNVKAPFRAIQNYVHFLLEDLANTLGGDPKQFLDGIRKAVDQANQQFSDLEALYQIRKHAVEFEPVDMKGFLEKIASTYADAYDRRLILSEQWPVLRTEPILLRQILMALIENGFKYNQSAVKKVEIGWQKAADKFEIFVRDNGIGIEPQYHGHIFYIFKRLHTEDEYEGTGIGLAIVKKAVKKIGGRMRIESAVGEGSTFVISLPVAMVEGNPEA